MKRIILIIALICLAGCVNLYAQEGVTPVNLDASTNGDTIDGVSPQSTYLLLTAAIPVTIMEAMTILFTSLETVKV